MKIVYSLDRFGEEIKIWKKDNNSVAILVEGTGMNKNLIPTYEQRLEMAHKLADKVVYIFQPDYYLLIGHDPYEHYKIYGQKQKNTVDEVIENRCETELDLIFIQIPGDVGNNYETYKKWCELNFHKIPIKNPINTERIRAIAGAPIYMIYSDLGVDYMVSCPFWKPYNVYIHYLCKLREVDTVFTPPMTKEKILNGSLQQYI